eukprot:CAMPEP_0197633578 /NCGR_PEP_ID=MMETSP1338-20131121/9917_1 /TAXON_ID=43686 ORGANISM="Pelagodinium beii, Strain RCC1491" /NCGR_SAMPLE_ID=MMETSP1338 /ASSEMBLY_ACC=CAM_ASM_000754 /LENGTH=101 /DNA_ID=CAMNT_0043205273 /DNA_START=41 /DNA_END=346 /DNA_ORIENTATION=+
MALGGLAGINCHCQWGLTGILLGIVVIAAAGVFTAIPVFFDYFAYQWYYALCWFWFGLGVAILAFGIVYEVLVGPAKIGKAREIEGDEEDGVAPTPYIMIQ